MPLAGQFLQRVTDRGAGAMRTLPVDSHAEGQLIGRLEADPANVIGQLIGIGLDGGDGVLAVGPVDPHGASRGHVVLGQEQHDLADLALLLPALLDALQPSGTDALDLQQEVGGLVEDVERALAMDADDPGGQSRPDAANRAGAQVLLDPFRGRGMRRL